VIISATSASAMLGACSVGLGQTGVARSNMSGFLQLSIFLGTSALMCYAIFLILGTVGFIPSLMFVCCNYEAVKSE